MIMKFLIKDNLTIKTYSGNALVDICPNDQLTVDHFESHGINLGDLPNLTELRKSLEETSLKLLYLSEEEIKLYYKEYGLPKGEFIEMNTDANISMNYILHVKSITITGNEGANGDLLRFIISTDKGSTWLTYYNDSWMEISKEEIEVIKKGMSLNLINSLDSETLKIITEEAKNIRFCWYMRKSNITTELNVSNIAMKYEVNI